MAEIEGLKIRIGGDVNPILAALKTLDNQYSQTVKNLKASIGKIGALQSLEQVTDASGKQKKQIEKLRTELQAAGIDTANLAGEQDRLAAQLRRTEGLQARSRIQAGAAVAQTAGIGAAADTLGLKSHAAIRAEIDKTRAAYATLKASGQLTATELTQAHHRQKEMVRALAEQMNGATVMQDRMNRAMGLLNAGMAAVATLAPAMQVARIADEMSLLDARVKLVSASSSAAKTAMAGIFEIAARAQAPVEAVGASYVKFAGTIRALGGTQQESLRFTEAVALGLRVSGASATEAGSAMMQLAQAMQSGKLSGDEFRSVNENGGKLLDYLARQLGKSRGELALMAEEGKLTAEVLKEALPAALEAIRQDAEKLPQTVGGAMQQVSNEFARWVSESEAVADTLRGLSVSVRFLAEHMDGLMNVGIAAGVLGIGAAFWKLAQALRVARVAGVAFAASNPWLLALAAVSVGVAAFYGVGVAAEEAGDKASDAADETRQRYDELNDRLVHLAEQRTRREKALHTALAESAQAAQKTTLEAQKKSIAEQIAGTEKLRDSLVAAYKKAGDEAETARKKASDLRAKVAQKTQDRADSRQDKQFTDLDKSYPAAAQTARQVAANEALAAAEAANARAVEARYAGNTEAAAKYAAEQDRLIARAETLAGAIENQALSQQLLDAAAQAAARNLSEQAAMEDAKAANAEAQQAAIAGQLNDHAQKVADLYAQLDAMEARLKEITGEQAAIKLTADQEALEKTKAEIAAVQAELAKIPPEVRTKIVVERMTADPLPAKASGGLITGPGTGTSDSILARLSNGEFVMRAAAVRQWGVDRMAALNAGRLPQFARGGMVLRAVESSLPRYAEGGPVFASPRASGGEAKPLANLTIVLPSGRAGTVQATQDSAGAFAALVRQEALRVTG